MMCTLSVNPVMKMTGTCASARFCLSRRQVSKPSVPGMTASMRITSGVTFPTMERACSPSRATRTVMPASSMASVSMRSVSGESSTTSTRSLSFLRMVAASGLQCGEVTLEIECVDENADLRDEAGIFGCSVLKVIQLLLDASDVSDLAEADQLDDVVARRQSWLGYCGRGVGDHVPRVIDPFNVQKHVDRLEQLPQVDRLHEIVVVQALAVGEPVRVDGVRGQNHNGGALRQHAAQAPRGLPAIHLGHRDVEKDQVGLVALRRQEAVVPAGGGLDVKTQRCQQILDERSLDLVIVDHQYALTRADIAAHAILLRRRDAGARHFRQQQLDAEQASPPDLAGDRDVAAHDIDQQLGDGQAEPGAGGGFGAGGPGVLERLEDSLEIVAMDADAGVLNLELGDLVAIFEAENHLPGFGEFDGVGQKIDENLAQPVLIGMHDGGQRPCRLVVEGDALGGRLQAKHVDDLVEKLRRAHLVAIEMKAAGFDL